MTEAGATPLAGLVPALSRRVPAILTEVLAELSQHHPSDARFLRAEFDDITVSAQRFMTHLVGLAEGGPGVMSAELNSGVLRTVFEEIGRQQCRQGRTVTSLLSAYRIGGRVAWQHVVDVALECGLTAQSFANLGSAVFAAVDQLSTASLHGYLEEHSSLVSAHERLREELAELLLSDRSDMAAVRATAERVGWHLPGTAAVALVEPDDDVDSEVIGGLDRSCLRHRRPGALVAIVPDPDGPGRREWLAKALRGTGAVLGTTTTPEHLPSSMHIAEIAARLRRQQVLTDDPVFAEEHLDAIIVHHDEELLDALRKRYLAPLRELPRPAGERLCQTLASWLRHMGNRQTVAQDLHIHPQTVAYRVNQLRERFGDSLDDPHTRAALILALAWEPDDGAGRSGVPGPRTGYRTDAPATGTSRERRRATRPEAAANQARTARKRPR